MLSRECVAAWAERFSAALVERPSAAAHGKAVGWRCYLGVRCARFVTGMKLVLLGTTGYHPCEQRHTACLMLPELGVVLDAGTAMFRVRDYLLTNELAIYLTHAHLDHVIGLTYLFDIFQGRPGPTRAVVYAAAEKQAALEQHLFAAALFPVRPPCEFRTLEGVSCLPAGGTLQAFPLEHPGGSLGFRLEWPGHSLAYVTDTTARRDAPYIEAIRGVDLLVHECNFTDAEAAFAQQTGHSCPTPVAEVARAAQVGRLVLVHLNPLASADAPVDVEHMRSIFPRIELGFDRMEIEF